MPSKVNNIDILTEQNIKIKAILDELDALKTKNKEILAKLDILENKNNIIEGFAATTPADDLIAINTLAQIAQDMNSTTGFTFPSDVKITGTLSVDTMNIVDEINKIKAKTDNMSADGLQIKCGTLSMDKLIFPNGMQIYTWGDSLWIAKEGLNGAFIFAMNNNKSLEFKTRAENTLNGFVLTTWENGNTNMLNNRNPDGEWKNY